MTTNLILTCAIVVISELYRMYKLEAGNAFEWCNRWCELSTAMDWIGVKVFYQTNLYQPLKVGVIQSYDEYTKLFTLTNGDTIHLMAIVARYDSLYPSGDTND